MINRIFPILFSAILGLGMFLAGCGKNEVEQDMTTDSTATATTQAATSKTGEGTGKVVEISQDKKSITLDHGQIGDMMEPMVMPFDIHDPALLNDLKIGDSIRFTVQYQEGSGYSLTSVQKL